MPLDCIHWSDCNVSGGGCCAEQRFGGMPSIGVCEICEHRKSADGTGIGKLIRAVPKIVTALTISADTPQSQGRLQICETCDYYKNARCMKCGCIMSLKTRLEREHCPIGKW